MGNRVYVGNLSYDTTRESLEAAFSAIGQVREISIPTDRESGRMRGFAFVTMGSAQDANAVITQLNGSMLDGRALKVNEAQERPAGGGGGGGGRRGGGGGRDRY
ncbi:MAG: RNA-binding protein [Deltaproteobacteria bacterium]|nr:RNA-binding protein [Deltaproteobacteria bacterium]